MVNVDAAMFNQSRRMCIGVVIRDHNGKCLAACSEHQEEVATPEIAEAVAMRRVLSLAAEEGFANIIISSDCLSVVNRVSALEMDRSICGSIIHDICHMASLFNSCSFKHVKRGLNVPAHKLAKFSEFSVCSVWREYTPDCIREDICNDILIM
jgi:ribonuclease HI